MPNYKNNNYIMIVLTIMLFSVVTIINYLYDPLGHHNSDGQYLNDGNYERYQNAGIINNERYNAVVMGTSLSENIKVSIIDSLFQVNTIKIPVSGATAKEQNIIGQYAIKLDTKYVFWDLHLTSFSGDTNRMHRSQTLPQYLYDGSRLNDLQLFPSMDIFQLTIKNMRNRQLFYTNNMDILYNTYVINKSSYGKKYLYEYINANKEKMTDNSYLKTYSYNNLKNNFDHNILPIITSHPQTEFKLYFPPYTIPYYYGYYINDMLKDIFAFKDYLCQLSTSTSNMDLYDFTLDTAIISNIKYYKDTHHYDQSVSDILMFSIKSNAYIIDSTFKASQYVEQYRYIESELKMWETAF